MEQTLRNLIDKNCTRQEIAREIGRSEASVYRLLRKYGLKTKRHNNHDPNATERRCRYCGRTKPITDFVVAGTINGVLYRRWRCSSCFTEMKRNRRIAMRDWLHSLKDDGLKCERCGNGDFRVLHFHHTSADKEFNVADSVRAGFSRERILTEIAKCEVLCANCHAIETYEAQKETK